MSEKLRKRAATGAAAAISGGIVSGVACVKSELFLYNLGDYINPEILTRL